MDQIQQYLFATPWWLVAALVALSLVGLVGAILKRDAKLRNVLLVALLVTVGWLAATTLVTTPTEAAVARTNALVDSYNDADWGTFGDNIDGQTRLTGGTASLVGEQITIAAQATRQSRDDGDVSITSTEVRRDAAGIRVDISVVADADDYYGSFRTAWRFDYVERGGVWMLDRIEILPTDRVKPEDLMRRIRRGQ